MPGQCPSVFTTSCALCHVQMLLVQGFKGRPSALAPAPSTTACLAPCCAQVLLVQGFKGRPDNIMWDVQDNSVFAVAEGGAVHMFLYMPVNISGTLCFLHKIQVCRGVVPVSMLNIVAMATLCCLTGHIRVWSPLLMRCMQMQGFHSTHSDIPY